MLTNELQEQTRGLRVVASGSGYDSGPADAELFHLSGLLPEAGGTAGGGTSARS
jgi:hypothetical protein